METINKVLYNVDQRADTTEAQKAQARANIGIHDQGHGNWLVPDRPQPDNDLILTTDRYGAMQWVPQAEAGGIKPSQLSSYILAGDNITITPGSSSITINSTGGTQLQSNWAESDSSSVQFIQNKPTIPVVPSMKTLVAGTNVSIVEGTNDVTISATAAPQLQANWNETSTSSVQYIQNKPTIPTLPTMKPLVAGSNITITEGVSDVTIAAAGGSQVQADWTEADTSSPAYIQNKPTLATVATSGSYYDLSNRPTLATVAQTGNYNDLVGRPSIPSMSLFHHSQHVSITAGQYVTPETYNLNAFVPANSKFYGSLTIERLSNINTSGAYHFVLAVPGNEMTCNFGDYPAARQSGHNIGFGVDNSSGGSQYQLYFQLSGQFEAQNITVHVDGIVFN